MDCFDCSGDPEYCKIMTCQGQAYSCLYRTIKTEIAVFISGELASLYSHSIFKGCSIEDERYCEKQREVDSGHVDCKVIIMYFSQQKNRSS